MKILIQFWNNNVLTSQKLSNECGGSVINGNVSRSIENAVNFMPLIQIYTSSVNQLRSVFAACRAVNESLAEVHWQLIKLCCECKNLICCIYLLRYCAVVVSITFKSIHLYWEHIFRFTSVFNIFELPCDKTASYSCYYDCKLRLKALVLYYVLHMYFIYILS